MVYKLRRIYDLTEDVLCQITLGIIPGYKHNNYEFPKVEDFCFELKEQLETICDHLNYYIPILVYPAVTVYKTEWGCSNNGEKVYVLEAAYNPQYNTDIGIDGWETTMILITQELKKLYNQTTVRVQFIPTKTLVL